jgi:transcription elongation GreA/GreB family factor
MSRAFVKESEEIEPLPERSVSSHPNYVTARGQALIETELVRLSSVYAEAQVSADRDALARIGRDLRYWQQRRASAQTVSPFANPDEVHFGSTVTLKRNTVTLKRNDGRRQTWRIVGEDEADPANGSISYVSPVARALMGKKIGDLVEVGRLDANIVAIE